MIKTLKSAALFVMLLAPPGAYAGFGDPNPNAAGVVAPNGDGSASQSRAGRELAFGGNFAVCQPGFHATTFPNGNGYRCVQDDQ
jgi:hypothetical protein